MSKNVRAKILLGWREALGEFADSNDAEMRGFLGVCGEKRYRRTFFAAAGFPVEVNQKRRVEDHGVHFEALRRELACALSKASSVVLFGRAFGLRMRARKSASMSAAQGGASAHIALRTTWENDSRGEILNRRRRSYASSSKEMVLVAMHASCMDSTVLSTSVLQQFSL